MLPLPSSSTSVDTQHALLLQESERKQHEIERLQKIGEKLHVQSISPTAAVALSGGQTDTIDQIIAIALIVQEGRDREVTDQYIHDLNTAVGSTEAHAVQIEEEVKKLDGTIEQMRQLVAERKKTVALGKKVAQEIIK